MKDIKLIIYTLIGSAISVLSVCLIFYTLFLNSNTSRYSQFHTSYSIEDSVKRGTFIKKVAVIPNRIFWENNTINIFEAWIEKRLKIKYVFGFFKKKIYLKETAFCFKIDRNDLFDSLLRPMFVIGDSGGAMVMNSFLEIKIKESDIVFSSDMKNIIFDINADNQATFNISITKDFKKRNKDILVITGLDKNSPYIENIKK